MWFYREISAPLLFALAQMEPNIQWRTKQFRLKWGGLVEALDKKKIQVWNDFEKTDQEAKHSDTKFLRAWKNENFKSILMMDRMLP